MDTRTTAGTAADAERTAPPGLGHLRRGGDRRRSALAPAAANLLVLGVAAVVGVVALRLPSGAGAVVADASSVPGAASCQAPDASDGLFVGQSPDADLLLDLYLSPCSGSEADPAVRGCVLVMGWRAELERLGPHSAIAWEADWWLLGELLLPGQQHLQCRR